MSELGWAKASDDDENDLVCTDGSKMIGRVYIHDTGGFQNGKWCWFFSNRSGVTESRREAMLAVEEAYEKSRAEG